MRFEIHVISVHGFVFVDEVRVDVRWDARAIDLGAETRPLLHQMRRNRICFNREMKCLVAARYQIVQQLLCLRLLRLHKICRFACFLLRLFVFYVVDFYLTFFKLNAQPVIVDP